MSQARVFYRLGNVHVTHSLLFPSSSWSLLSQQTLLLTVFRLLQHNGWSNTKGKPKISEKQRSFRSRLVTIIHGKLHSAITTWMARANSANNPNFQSLSLIHYTFMFLHRDACSNSNFEVWCLKVYQWTFLLCIANSPNSAGKG